jgi:RNA 2',3'-cyclic 3'-phosphodiesterase
MNDAKNGRNHAEIIRTFVCIDIPESIKVRIEKLQHDLRHIDAQISWVKPTNIHLTLKFLGDVPKANIPMVNTAVTHATGCCSPFQVTVGSAGCFPSSRNPSILWIGISRVSEDLLKLRDAIEEQLAQQDFKRETKKFTPHLTIARIRNPRNAGQVADAFMTCGFADESFQAGEIIVMASHLSPQGSIYTPQAVIPLKG